MLFIGFNMLTMTLDHYQQTDTFSMILDYLNMIFIAIFSSECLMKVFALRYHYFVEPWNLFDFVVVILSILGELPLKWSLITIWTLCSFVKLRQMENRLCIKHYWCSKTNNNTNFFILTKYTHCNMLFSTLT